MKNLSEQIGYFETLAVEQYINDYEEKYTTSPYYTKLKEIIAKQKNNEIVLDKDYEAIPTGGLANYWSAADGYYHVNFHYCFYNKLYSASVSLLYKFMDFLTVVNFALCRETEVYNWLNSFKLWALRFVSCRPDMEDKCKFIEQILEAVNPIAHNELGSLINIDRSIDPDIFDNAVRYFRTRNAIYDFIEQQYADEKSLKAKDVMEILGISRRTLTRYVNAGTITIDCTINGRYKYNKLSVFRLLRHDKVN